MKAKNSGGPPPRQFAFGAALANPHFQAVLAILVALPAIGLYLWVALLSRLWWGQIPGRDFAVYLQAAGLLNHGQSPYAATQIAPDVMLTFGYVYTPLVAALLQPLARLPAAVAITTAAIAAQVAIAIFLITTLAALRVRSWPAIAALVALTVWFEPLLTNVFELQATLLLLALSGVWLFALRSDRGWGAGAAVGLSLAIKFMYVPLLVGPLRQRRLGMLMVTALAFLIPTLAAYPGYLPAFLSNVLLPMSGGSGFFDAQSPAWVVGRALHPEHLYLGAGSTPTDVRVLTLALTAAAIVVLWNSIPRVNRFETAHLSAAAMVATIPFVLPYIFPQHLVVLLLPLLVLVTEGVRNRNLALLTVVAVSWALISPVHAAFIDLVHTRPMDTLSLQVVADLSPIGGVALWVASIVWLRRAQKGAAVGPVAKLDPARTTA